MVSTFFRVAVVAAAVVCLSVGAHAQNFTASTPSQNLTAYKQAVSNFTGSVPEPSFPCDGISSGLLGSYKMIDLDTASDDTVDDLEVLISDVYNYFLYSTVNLTTCELPYIPLVNLSSACSQVVSGTNYALEFTAAYNCQDVDDNGDYTDFTETIAPLRTTVYVPIQDASLATADQAFNGPVIRDIWFFDTPEVAALPEATPEQVAPEAAPAAEAEAPASDSDSGITLLSPGGDSLDSGTTSFTFSPSTSSPSTSNSPSPTPELVPGFDVAAQNQSIISG